MRNFSHPIRKEALKYPEEGALYFTAFYEIPWIAKWEYDVLRDFPGLPHIPKQSRRIQVRWWPKFKYDYLMPNNLLQCILKITAKDDMDVEEVKAPDLSSEISSIIKEKGKGWRLIINLGQFQGSRHSYLWVAYCRSCFFRVTVPIPFERAFLPIPFRGVAEKKINSVQQLFRVQHRHQ